MSVPVYVVQRPKTIKITSQAVINIVPTVVSFSFTATQDQTEFTFDSTPVLVHLVAINGLVKRETEDYTVSGDTLTLLEGVDAGALVFGTYQ